jgi:UDP-N-acetylmuramate dehydrogenase
MPGSANTPSARSFSLQALRQAFGERLQENVKLANYTTAHVGGPVAAMLIVHDAAELEQAVRKLWDLDIAFTILGSGTNVLVSDSPLAGVVLINRAKAVKIDSRGTPPSVWAESGANFGALARQVALRGYSGLEWAGTVPGTVGGAVYGNAGAFGSDTRANLLVAEILHRKAGKQVWGVDQMEYDYRTSIFKKQPGQAIILSARFSLVPSTAAQVQAKMEENSERRRSTQPNGASLGSMFKNPPGDYAGRLIEAAGLKGARVGGVQVSPIHANFFINEENATANDFIELIRLVQQTVWKEMKVRLELEIETLGDWPPEER